MPINDIITAVFQFAGILVGALAVFTIGAVFSAVYDKFTAAQAVSRRSRK